MNGAAKSANAAKLKPISKAASAAVMLTALAMIFQEVFIFEGDFGLND